MNIDMLARNLRAEGAIQLGAVGFRTAVGGRVADFVEHDSEMGTRIARYGDVEIDWQSRRESWICHDESAYRRCLKSRRDERDYDTLQHIEDIVVQCACDARHLCSQLCIPIPTRTRLQMTPCLSNDIINGNCFMQAPCGIDAPIEIAAVGVFTNLAFGSKIERDQTKDAVLYGIVHETVHWARAFLFGISERYVFSEVPTVAVDLLARVYDGKPLDQFLTFFEALFNQPTPMAEKITVRDVYCIAIKRAVQCISDELTRRAGGLVDDVHATHPRDICRVLLKIPQIEREGLIRTLTSKLTQQVFDPNCE